MNSAWLPPPPEKQNLQSFLSSAIVVVDRLVQCADVDLPSPVTIDRGLDVGQQSGQLRLVVGAHTFAGGLPFGLGAHDLGR